MSILNVGKLAASLGIKLPSFTTPNLPQGEVGMLVYDTTDKIVKVYNGTKWVKISSSGSAAASGGTEVTANGYKYHVFGSTGPSVLNVTSAGAIEVLVVGGGGCAGNNNAGGGGAGGLIYIPIAADYQVGTGAISINVGTGGAAFSGTGNQTGSSGNPSTFGALEAIGGGRGGYWNSNNTAQEGGSGGGGNGNPTNLPREPGKTGTQPIQPGDSGLYGYGNPGGQGGRTSGDTGGGGGGGAGGAGSGTGGPGSEGGWPGGPGGDGKAIAAFPGPVVSPGIPAPNRTAFQAAVGTSGYYGGGGAGAAGGTATPAVAGGTGGVGGGGPGGAAQTGTNGTPGTYGTGGGGGGGDNTQGGSGAPGIVIVRYEV